MKKKLLIVISYHIKIKVNIYYLFIILIFSNNVNAKTIGNFIGIDLIKTNTTFSMHQLYLDSIYNDYNPYTDPTPSYGYGFKYNFAINYRKFFLSPGIFYENNQNKNNFNKSSYKEYNQDYFYGNSFVKIKDRYGIKLDLGYDINDYFSFYGSAGIVNNRYLISTSLYPYYFYDNQYKISITKSSIIANNPFKTIGGNAKSPFFGGGIRIKFNKNWLLNGEYNFTKFSLKNKFSRIANDSDTPNLVNFYNSISTLKLGINYNF